jgi:hypothetical protein
MEFGSVVCDVPGATGDSVSDRQHSQGILAMPRCDDSSEVLDPALIEVVDREIENDLLTAAGLAPRQLECMPVLPAHEHADVRIGLGLVDRALQTHRLQIGD